MRATFSWYQTKSLQEKKSTDAYPLWHMNKTFHKKWNVSQIQQYRSRIKLYHNQEKFIWVMCDCFNFQKIHVIHHYISLNYKRKNHIILDMCIHVCKHTQAAGKIKHSSLIKKNLRKLEIKERMPKAW